MPVDESGPDRGAMPNTLGRERPIIFTADSVLAILDGTKTQTRRVIKNPGRLDGLMLSGEEQEWCPYGRAGDRLWVRETWAWSGDKTVAEAERIAQGEVWYRTDPRWTNPAIRWRSPIHMPRWASRLTLEITEVRVQRVQEISEEDAKAEGAPFDAGGNEELGVGYRIGFCRLWDSLNAKRGYSWESNPWVWALTFRRVHA